MLASKRIPSIFPTTPSTNITNLLYGWGYNAFGQLGDNSTIDKKIPTILDSSSNWYQVYAGQASTIGIKNDGSLWGWGDNYYYELSFPRSQAMFVTPTRIGNLNDWEYVAAGAVDTLAIKKDGTLWAWGCNYNGILGNGTTDTNRSPTQIGTDNTWKNISTSDSSVCAIKNDGTLWAWGWNYSGKLGLNHANDVYFPTQNGTSNQWYSVNHGFQHTSAIKTDGTLWMWGDNGRGQLGNNSTIGKSSPIQTIIGGNDWKLVSCGHAHTAAIKTDGTLWSWGYNYYGQLGLNDITQRLSPIQVGSDTNWKDVHCGAMTTYATKTDNTTWVCGKNNVGEFGLNDTINRSVMTNIPSAIAWKSLSVGKGWQAHVMAIV